MNSKQFRFKEVKESGKTHSEYFWPGHYGICWETIDNLMDLYASHKIQILMKDLEDVIVLIQENKNKEDVHDLLDDLINLLKED